MSLFTDRYEPRSAVARATDLAGLRAIRRANERKRAAQPQAKRTSKPKPKPKAAAGLSVAQQAAFARAVRADIVSRERNAPEAKARVAYALGRGPRPAETRAEAEATVRRAFGGFGR